MYNNCGLYEFSRIVVYVDCVCTYTVVCTVSASHSSAAVQYIPVL